MTTIGFVGVGMLADALVRALAPCSQGGNDIHLSPRSTMRSSALAGEFDNVMCLDSNRAVVERAELVFLTMRPPQLEDALAEVVFSPDQTVVSLLAGTPLDTLRHTVRGAPRLVRALALPSIAHGRGPIAILPDDRQVSDLLGMLGEVIPVRDEAELDLLVAAGGMMSTYLELQNRIVDALAARGCAETTAYRFVASMVEGLAGTARGLPVERRHGLPVDHETPGGINERCRRYLSDAGWFDQIPAAIDAITSHDLRGRASDGAPQGEAGRQPNSFVSGTTPR